MSRPGVGNPGNKGGGRKPESVERKDKIWLKEKWEQDSMLEALKEKLKSGKYSIRDVFLAKALQGNERILNVCANKMLPDLHELAGQDGGPLVIKWLNDDSHDTLQPQKPV